MVTVETYRKLPRDSDLISAEEWEMLADYLDEARPTITATRAEHGIESPPPEIQTDEDLGTEIFNPYGWVGTFPGNVTVVPDKLSQPEFSDLLSEVSGWIELMDLRTAEAVLSFLPSQLLDFQTLLESYSRLLIQLTESILAHRPPVAVNRTTTTDHEAHGPIDVPRTARLQASGRPELASRKIEFSFDTLPNRLLLRFHAELASRLTTIPTGPSDEESPLQTKQEYHTEFVENGLPGGSLLDESLSTEFSDPAVIRETRAEATGPMLEVVKLWEGYQEEVALEIDIGGQFEAAVKPASKLYELWVLRQLIGILQSVLDGVTYTFEDGLSMIRVGDGVRIRYDSPVDEHSRFLRQGFGVRPNRPDYVIEQVVDGSWQPVWVGDAKFRYADALGKPAYDRFIGYLIDYLGPETRGEGTLICISDGSHLDVERADYTVRHWRLNPSTVNSDRDGFEELFEELLSGNG